MNVKEQIKEYINSQPEPKRSDMQALHKLTPPGTVYATAMVAAVLSLQTNKYSFDFIDTLNIEGKKNMDVFRVQTIHTIGR